MSLEIFTPYAGAAGIILPINGKFTIGKLTKGKLKFVIVLC